MNERVIFAAALKFAFPLWLAVTEHVPAANKLMLDPEILQTVGVVEAKLTAKPDVAVAVAPTEPEDIA